MSKPEKFSMASLVAQACHYIDQSTGGIVPPIQTSTTYARNNDYALIGDYSYSRNQNPTYDQVEEVAAMMDGGVEAKVFASGLAAVATVFETVNSGEHIVAPKIMYHGTRDWLQRISAKRNIGLTLFDAGNLANLAAAIEPGKTSIVWIETPINPTWEVIDIEAAAAIAHDAGAILAVDCTVSTPVTTRALDLGADLVFHSATKYFNGHSDVTAGILVSAEHSARWQDIKIVRTLSGGVPGPFECWLLLRGMRTLFIRFERAARSALKIATALEHNPNVEKVLYPGLESHAGHEIAARQMTNGFGGMMSILVRGGERRALQVACALELFVSATSLGGVESLVEHRATIEGTASGVPENLLRLSIGIEDCGDLLADLEQALASA